MYITNFSRFDLIIHLTISKQVLVNIYYTIVDPTNVVLSYKLFLENILLEKIANLI